MPSLLLTTLFSLVALLPSLVSTQTTPTSVNNSTGGPCRVGFCVNCDAAAGCLKCIGAVRNFTQTQATCDSTINESDCASWASHPHNYCETCRQGYLINENNQCVKSTIGCCKRGSIVNGQEVCTACEHTMPNYERTKCDGKLEIPNCRHGMRQGQLEACAYCKQGYSVYGYGCVPNCVHGCSHCVKAFNGTQFVRRCVECDWNRKFFMTSENVCSFGKILGFGMSFVLILVMGLIG